MLHRLYIKNYAIIDEINLQFQEGFVVMTGETGAGKSIIMGALDLILGSRSNSSALNPDRGSTVIEAVFGQIDTLTQAEKDDYEVEDDELTIRRVITSSGKSRCFVNDLPVSLTQLSALRSKLIDIHRQFDNSWLFAEASQLLLLDSLSGQVKARDAYHSKYLELLTAKRELDQAIDQQNQLLQQQDFITYQWTELDGLALDEMDQDALEAEQAKLANVSDIKESLSSSVHILEEGEQNVLDLLRQSLQAISGSAVDEQNKTRWSQVIENSIEELRELSNALQDYSDSAESDPARLAEIDGRLDQLYRLQQKHQVQTVAELITLRDQWADQIHAGQNSEANIEGLKSRINELESDLRQRAEKISKKRKTTAPKFASAVLNKLSDLSMPNAQLEVSLARNDTLGPWGIDEMQLLFTANKGQQLSDFRKIASGGERSRLALCIKAEVADKMTMPTLVFDEIDAGVSGDVSLKMGQMLRSLSHSHQVICITHSAQIAAAGSQHLFIYKIDQGATTETQIKELATDDRIHEIAKMLSSDPPSKEAKANATQLLALS